ncbi:DUF421 domain-containing protein [Hymenobacter weizhouensis]|uniref:DUF421 domain-containing protein n=1 Tax=Hymenobacter sp. YIM 151500-1 TaxID=2987689 RepID=UPI0022263BA9|nr:YetF domain-containing protein [Hymenobacter sp. YIM 151500-1]UYZ64639.1 DUF421 domain-containing protein [Hymenobacter sp. YIM 151500-1]
MESVLRAVIVYGVLLLIFRLVGRRAIAQSSVFDLVLLLIIANVSENALLGEDNSMTNALLQIVTLSMLFLGLSLLKQRSPQLQRLLEGLPVVIVHHGRPVPDLLHQLQVDEADILNAARQSHGLERMAQIKYAILEINGVISIVPASPADAPPPA